MFLFNLKQASFRKRFHIWINKKAAVGSFQSMFSWWKVPMICIFWTSRKYQILFLLFDCFYLFLMFVCFYDSVIIKKELNFDISFSSNSKLKSWICHNLSPPIPYWTCQIIKIEFVLNPLPNQEKWQLNLWNYYVSAD